VRAVKGNLQDKKGMIAAMRKATFKLHARQVQLRHNHLPDRELLPAEGGRGPTPTSTR
jgi:hypothetical protein